MLKAQTLIRAAPVRATSSSLMESDMKEEKKLLKLSLQFFGEDDNDFLDDVDTDDPDDTDGDFEDADGDFDEEFFDEDGDLNDDADDGADNGADNGASDTDNGADKDPSSVGEPTPSPEEEGKAEEATPNADLISELRALGYVGNDLAALTADMKAKREAKASEEAREQAKADRADGKAHVRSSVPGKSASGDGTGGVNERRVISVAENAKISREEARRMLAKHARLIEGK